MTYSLYGYAPRRPKKEIMAGIDCESSKIVARNTVRYVQNGLVRYRFHHTTIYEETLTGFIIRTGSYHTYTTRERIDMALRAEGWDGWSVWQNGRYGHKESYLRSNSQMVPIEREIEVKNGRMEERYSYCDPYFRRNYWLSWTHMIGAKENPNHVEWDGSASQLRRFMVEYQSRIIPWNFLNRVPGATMNVVKGTDYNSNALGVRYVCANKKIKIRDLFEEVCRAGHISNIKDWK